MTAWIWHHAAHSWLPSRPGLPRVPRLGPTARRLGALRAGLIVALCAMLAGSCGLHLGGALQGPLSPTRSAGPAGA